VTFINELEVKGTMSKTSDLNRRKFMEIGIYTISGAIASVSGVALARFAVGPSFNKEDVQNETNGFTRVVLEYETKDGWLTSTERRLAYIKKVKETEVIAISAGCTHLGCIVTWDEDQNIFKCPCHDGRYDSEGRVISGPPPAPLKRHQAKIEDGKILLSTQLITFGGEESV
jgi:Rieske Fe-S protein